MMISAGAIVFRNTNSGREYLLLKHVKTGVHWGFPKGRIEEGESLKDAALREIKEETGFSVREFIQGFQEEDTYSFISKEDIKIDKRVVFFLAEFQDKGIVLSHEHSDAQWFLLKEALGNLENENLRKILKKADSMLDIRKGMYNS